MQSETESQRYISGLLRERNGLLSFSLRASERSISQVTSLSSSSAFTITLPVGSMTSDSPAKSMQPQTPEPATNDYYAIPKAQGLKLTGAFLDEISHDIPHQNWGPREWEQDFKYMKAIGIDTVIVIRSGYRKFLTYPSEYLMKKRGAYAPSLDLIELFLTLSDKYGMKFYFAAPETVITLVVVDK